MKIALISLIIAICSALGTLIHWLLDWRSNRKSFDINVVSVYEFMSQLVMVVSFENKSRQPISITQLSWVIDDDSISPSFLREKIYETNHRRNGEIVSSLPEYSLAFPINLGGYCSHSGLLRFDTSQSDLQPLPSTAHFVVCTNRGNPERIELPLPEALPFEKMFES